VRSLRGCARLGCERGRPWGEVFTFLAASGVGPQNVLLGLCYQHTRFRLVPPSISLAILAAPAPVSIATSPAPLLANSTEIMTFPPVAMLSLPYNGAQASAIMTDTTDGMLHS